MLTGFTVAVPIKFIYCTFGGNVQILIDNGTEFKNEQMDDLYKQLDIKRVYWVTLQAQ